MWRLLLLFSVCGTGAAIENITCPTHHLRGMWNGRVAMNCTAIQDKDSYVVMITCYKKIRGSWVNITHFPDTYHQRMNRGKYLNANQSKYGPSFFLTHFLSIDELAIEYHTLNNIFSINHTRCPLGYTEYMCNFTHYQGKRPPSFHWWLTGYPLMKLQIGIWIRHLKISIVLPQANVSQSTVLVHGKHGGPFTNTSEERTKNDNGTVTFLLTYIIPWSVTRGNVTVDVIIGTSHYKKTFLIDRHSSQFYTILAVLLVLASIVLLAFILHRMRYGTNVPYTHDIE